MRLINLHDYETAAGERLERMTYDYYASGAMDEITLRENEAAYDRIRLRYRVFRDVSRRSLATRVLGQPISMPVLVAPTAFHRMAHPDGEAGTARAAAGAGTIMMLSTFSNTPMEEVTAAARAARADAGKQGEVPGEQGEDPGSERVGGRAGSGPIWFQLYVYRDREVTRELVRRAEAAGCRGLVVTVDAPLLGRRERDVRNRFRLPDDLAVANLLPVGGGAETVAPAAEDSGLAAYVRTLLDPSLTWKELEWLVGATRLPVLVKGIVHPRDAVLAAEHGAVGVVVSNHGGRQLDTALPTIEALPEVAEAVADRDRFTVLLDGGVRRGTDVVKALALGADAVAVGRPILWGLAVDGAGGARRVLEILRREVDLALALCGCATVGEVREAGRDLVR